MSNVLPLTRGQREGNYRRQTGAAGLTPAQRRRADRKQRRLIRAARRGLR